MDVWKTLSEDEVFAAPPFLRVTRETVQLPDGRIVDDFYQVLLRSYALVVPITADGQVVTIEQYKHGPRRFGVSFPAGFVEDGEEPQLAARRELLEETGYKTGRIKALASYVDNGNQRGCRGFPFVATGCEWVQDADAGDLEQMEVVLRSAEEVDLAMAEGRLGVTHDVAAWGMVRILHKALFG